MKTYFKIHNVNNEVTYVEESPLEYEYFKIGDIIIPAEFDLKCTVNSFEFNFNSNKIFVNLFPYLN